MYKSIEKVESGSVSAKQIQITFSYKKLKMFSFVFMCVLSLGVMGVSLSSLNISAEVKNITSTWSPNVSDLGKLKYVTSEGEGELEVLSSVSEMAMPFENSYTIEVSSGVFMVDGLGSVVVKSCMDGKVTKVEGDGALKSIQITHGKGLVSVYELLDTVGVKVGDGVKKNQAIGISMSSSIKLKILFNNKIVAGLTVKDGDMIFD